MGDRVQESYTRHNRLPRHGLPVSSSSSLRLSHCHSQPTSPVIHRDLKPENILLVSAAHQECPYVTVTNFGLQDMFDLSSVGSVFAPGCMPASSSQQRLPSYSMPEFIAPE